MMTNTIQTPTITSVLDTSYQLIQEGLIGKGFRHLVAQLNEATKEMEQSTIDTVVREECLQHPVAKLILQEPMTRWSYQKPRGYSGDAVLIDYIYRHKSCDIADSYVGKELYGHANLASCSEAVRWRSAHVAEQIQILQNDRERKIDVISVASGHLRELAYIQDAQNKIDRFVCIDQDEQSNQEVRNTYAQYNFLEVIDDSISHVLKRKLDGQEFDFIYSSGLFDYLNDKIASRMIEILYSNLRPGGVMIIPNFLKGITEKAYMETFMKWNLIYRDTEDMIKLCTSLNLSYDQKEIYYDDKKTVVYLKITK